MSPRRHFYITAFGKRVEVSEEIYLEYFRSRRRDRAQRERDTYNELEAYNALDSDELLGVDAIPDLSSAGVEDTVISQIIQEQLHQYIAQLPEEDRNLIKKIYFSGLSERKAAQSLGIPQRTLHDRKMKVLHKLKKMM